MKRWGIFLWLAGTVWAQPLKWEKWEPAVFERAKREKRYVLLEMEAVWCHWCHVMEETTYKDPAVLQKLSDHYITVKVDQDARPDLSSRYEEYGWPATVIFSPEGTEIVCLTGYQAPGRMAAILQGVVDDPSPIVSLPALPPAASGPMSADLRARAEERHFSHFDFENGGYSFQHKFLNWDSCEYSLRRALSGDAKSAQMARLTLDGQLHLVDPVWGGVYQYSTDNDWVHPHFEKIMEHQANNLRIFTLAHRYFGDARYGQAAYRIASYLLKFLRSPEGGFYTSQDADVVKGEHSAEYFARDDKGRRALGMPAIDKHCYARETAWAAEALLLYGDKRTALSAMEWVLRERSLPGGGFRHDSKDAAGPYLGDTLACGRAFLALYEVTGERRWLERAVAAAGFLEKNFVVAGRAGLANAVLSGPLDRLTYVRDENVNAARFLNLLWHYTSQESHKRLRDQALSYLAVPAVALEFNTGGVLLADLESRVEPIHFTFGGGVRLSVSGYPSFYWMVTREAGPAGVLVCDERGVCSRPFQEAGALAKYLAKLLSTAAR